MISAYRSGKSYAKNLLLSLLIVYGLTLALSQGGWISDKGVAVAILCALIGHSLASFRRIAENARGKRDTALTEQALTEQERLTLYVGNLIYHTRKEDLIDLFSQFGTVHNARIILDKNSKKPTGYGFVELDADIAEHAVTNLNGSQFHGRHIKVSEANK